MSSSRTGGGPSSTLSGLWRALVGSCELLCTLVGFVLFRACKCTGARVH